MSHHHSADREPISRAGSNLPLWVIAVLFAGTAVAGVIADSVATAIGFAIAAAVVSAAAALDVGERLGQWWKAQPVGRQFALPLVWLAVVVAALIVVGFAVAGS